MKHPFTMKSPLSTGAKAEKWARQYLEKQGLKTRHCNYRAPGGEIDLIMMHGDILVFVEVRLRRHKQYATAAQSIDRRKQRRIIHAANHYLQAQGLWDKVPCRFDAICLNTDNGIGESYRVEWLRDAFNLS